MATADISAPDGDRPTVSASDLPYRDGEDRWTEDELAEVIQDLRDEVQKHRRAIEQAEAELKNLLQDSTEGAGRDPADVGSANFERDQEMSLAANARDMLKQSELALRMIHNGSYGRCESCGRPIGKGRLLVYPRATMCMSCKQRQERR
jgi:DnaK suppressor protein